MRYLGKLSASARSLLITAAILMVMMAIVIPIPASLLDVGLALSISTAMLILVMASLAEKPADFQAFPLLLLVSLIIRLALTVSSTRLILTEGDKGKEAAGKVISGFSEFVAGGSLLIGLTVFGVITVVNFMVITKGSGRMAEVSARFALDSLPGKQLAIDGDLNSGAITHEEAKQRRIQEQREISFYGSLDGASKFVKGDAVAGVIITLINLFVGLSVGLLVHRMSISEALDTYSHLTIGDGLVTQIPALITSMAAALLLARGGASETTSELISHQFFSNWQAPAIVAGGVLVLAMVPGLPGVTFSMLSVLFIIIAFLVYLYQSNQKDEISPSISHSPSENDTASIGDLLDADEIGIEISPSLIPLALDEMKGVGVRVGNIRNHVAQNFGIIMPDVRITDEKSLALGEYIIRLQGVIRGRGILRENSVLALGKSEVLEGITGEPVKEPVYDTPGRWIDTNQQDEAALSGLTVVNPMEVLSTHLLEIVRNNLPFLITMVGLQNLIHELRHVSDGHRAQINQRFFDSMLPDKVSPELLLFVLRSLLSERVSIRNLMLIVDAVYESRHAETREKVYEAVRKRMRAQITQQYSNEQGALEIMHLNPLWEAELTRAESDLSRNNHSTVLKLQSNLSEKVKQTLSGLGDAGGVVLTVPDHRRRMVHSMLEASGITVSVMGLEEIDPAVPIRLIGTVAA